jgi:hypothetical protein
MAFVSIQNILAPLSNKTHLISIFMAALLFLVLRLNGGGFTFTNSQRNSSSIRQSTSEVRTTVVKTPTRRVNPKSTSSLLAGNTSTPKKVRKPKKAKAPKTPAKPAAGNSGLDDIERSLGLR